MRLGFKREVQPRDTSLRVISIQVVFKAIRLNHTIERVTVNSRSPRAEACNI